MKKQMITALAVSAMMTLAMPFASFAAGRSCTGTFRPGNNCGGYAGANAASVIQMNGGCVLSNGNAIDLYTLLERGCTNGAAGNSCGTGCTNGSRGGSCSSGANCGMNSCTGGNSSTNSCSNGNCLTSGNGSSIAGTSCGNFSSRR